MAKPKLPTTGFFGNFETPTDDSRASDINDEEEVETKEEDKEKEESEEKEEESIEVQEEESDEEDELDPFIDTINFLSEKGLLAFDEDKVYEEEGEDLLEVVFQETLEKRFQEEFVDTIPEEYQSIIKHIKAGGSLEDWVEAIKPTDFDNINLEDEQNQKDLIEDHLKLTGMDDDDIKERIQELEDAGTLEKNAKTAIKYLKKAEDSKLKTYEQELEKTIKSQELQEAKALDDFKNTVLTTEDLKGIKLKDKVQRQELFDYITKPVKNGQSKYVIDNKDINNQLALAYMSMKGFSFKDLEKAVETKVTSKLRNSLSRISDLNAKGNGGTSVRESTQSKKIPKGPWG